MDTAAIESDVVLVGGGHAHVVALDILRSKGQLPSSVFTILLISPDPFTAYSGMLPGLVQGYYSYADSHIDLVSLCEACGIKFIQSSVTKLDTEQRSVFLADGRTIRGKILSLDIGSTPDDSGIQGGRSFATPVKPVEKFLAQLADFSVVADHEAVAHSDSSEQLHEIHEPPKQPILTIIGGGTAGVELAFAMRTRYSTTIALRLIHHGPQLLPDKPPALGQRVKRLLQDRDVEVLLNAPAREVTTTSVILADSRELDSTMTVLSTNASAAEWLQHSRIALDKRGFIRVNQSLQSLNFPWLFAAGDTASFDPRPLPKSGVFAVRQGRCLADNIIGALRGGSLSAYQPQDYSLTLMGTADGRAILSWGPLWFHSRCIWWLKEAIDRRFMRRFSARTT